MKQKYEIITPINGEEILKQIELAARTCYKSEAKIGSFEKCNNCNKLIASEMDETCGNLGDYCWYTSTGVIQGIMSHVMLCNKLIKRKHEAMLEFGGMITVKFTTNRGVSHELVRHRISSFAQESTRYCDYSNGHVAFIIPSWLNIKECILPENNVSSLVNKAPIEYLNHLADCEDRYKALINKCNWSPQQARDILPNALKTEINVSANIREWRHIFNQRTANGAHPDMIALMRPLLDDFKSQIPILFDDINY